MQDALTGAAGLALNEHTTEECERLATLACALTRTISPGALASSWAADGDADIAGAHLARRLADPGPDDGDLRPVSTAEGRALETAVARRLADTACSLAITGDKEDAAQASALWQAAATLTGLLPPYTGDTLRATADLVTAINGPSTKSSSNADKERLRQCAIDIAAIVGLDWEEGDNTIGTLQVAIATIAGWAKPMRRIAEDPADSLRRLKSDAAEVRKPAPRILQSADDAPCGSLSQVMHRHERVVMRLLNGRGWGMGEKACSGLVEGWTWSANAAKDFPARLIAEGLTEPECRHLSGLSAADAIAWCERRAAHAALAEGVRAKVGHAFEVKPAAPIKDPRLEVPGALLDDLRTEAGEHSIDAETIVRSAVREIKRRRAAMDILTAKRAEAESDVANWRTWALAGQRAAKDEAHAAIEARAQMQARLVAVERERDAAQEEAKALRVAVANKMSESMLAIMEGIAKGPTMEWRNGKP